MTALTEEKRKFAHQVSSRRHETNYLKSFKDRTCHISSKTNHALRLMVKMECETQRKRRRVESQTSNASALTQMTDLSIDSNTFSDTNSTNIQGNTPQPEQRCRTVSERRFSFFVNEDGTRGSFETGDSPPMGGRMMPRRQRRNTENSVNTQIKQVYCSSHNTAGFHKCNTTSCIQDESAQQRLLPSPDQTPFKNVFDTTRKMSLAKYDNNCPGNCQHSLQASNRSRSESNVENIYLSLDNPSDSYIRPVNTVVTNQKHGANTAIVPNGHILGDGQATDALSNPSSGYVRSDFQRTSLCCCIGDSSLELKFYKFGFKMVCLLNIILMLICIVAIAYYMIRDEHSPPDCFDTKDAADLVGEQQALVQKQPSGKYCPNYKRLIEKVAESKPRIDTCRPAIELDGVWNTKDDTLTWKTKRKSCGLELLDEDKATVLVYETGTYFLYSRILFGTKGLQTGQEFPMGHSLIKNNHQFEKVTQHCRANQSTVQHMSLLHTTEYLKAGDRIRVEVKRDSQVFMNEKYHKFGLFKL